MSSHQIGALAGWLAVVVVYVEVRLWRMRHRRHYPRHRNRTDRARGERSGPLPNGRVRVSLSEVRDPRRRLSVHELYERHAAALEDTAPIGPDGQE